MSPSRYIFLGIPAYVQCPEKWISKLRCMQRHFSDIESLFTFRFYSLKFVPPLFAVREIFKPAVAFCISLIKGWNAYSSPAESVVDARWHYGGFVKAEWERETREAERRGFVKTAASNRTRRNQNFPGTSPPPRSYPSRLFSRRSAAHVAANTRDALLSATSFLRKFEGNARLPYSRKMKFSSDNKR